MIFNRTIGLFIAALGVVAGLSAQPVDSTQEEPIEFSAIGWNREIAEMFYEVKGQSQPLPLQRRRPSAPQRYTGSPTIVFYMPVVVNEERRKVPIAEVTLKRPPYRRLLDTISSN